MKNNAVHYLAFKYLQGRKSRGINPAHYLSLAGISLGVLALLCVSSVMNGFRSDIQARIVGTFSELRLSAKNSQPLADYPDLLSKLENLGFKAAPVIRTELLLKQGQVVTPALCIGIDLKKQQAVSATLVSAAPNNEMQQGIIAGIAEQQSFEQTGIILGAGLASQLGVYLNDEIQVLSPLFNVPTAFGMIPRVRYLKVQAIFAAGMPEYDQNYCYLPLSHAGFFSGQNGTVDHLEIKLPRDMKLGKAASILKNQFPGYRIEDWSSFDSSLYAAMRFEKIIMFIIMLFMFIIASFNLTGNLLKTISQKKRELGLMKALGLKELDLQRVFLNQALLLCSLGIVLGLGVGTLLLLLQKGSGLIKLGMGDGSAITLPVQFQFVDYLLIVSVSYLLTLLSVLMPLRKIKTINAVELLRRAVN
ncbi:MAG TPA: FtsX-like permease family protein [Candidatus Cloacimonas sp.]|nr:FtsX-like permease family protein [Candidatus Cloacimonas sp.]